MKIQIKPTSLSPSWSSYEVEVPDDANVLSNVKQKKWKVFWVDIDILDFGCKELEKLLNNGWHIESSISITAKVYDYIVYVLSKAK